MTLLEWVEREIVGVKIVVLFCDLGVECLLCVLGNRAIVVIVVLVVSKIHNRYERSHRAWISAHSQDFVVCDPIHVVHIVAHSLDIPHLRKVSQPILVWVKAALLSKTLLDLIDGPKGGVYQDVSSLQEWRMKC
jgi:uncharacterized membrane protein (UPF0182 family)